MLYILFKYTKPCRRWAEAQGCRFMIEDDLHIEHQIGQMRATIQQVKESPGLNFYYHCYGLAGPYVVNNEIQRFKATHGAEGIDPALVEAVSVSDDWDGVTHLMDRGDTDLIDCHVYEQYFNELGGEFDELLYRGKP